MTHYLLKHIKYYYSDLASRELYVKLKALQYMCEDLKTLISQNPNDYTFKEKAYLYYLGVPYKKCYCGNLVHLDNDKNIFKQFCSVKCRNKSPILRSQISKTWTPEKRRIKSEKTKQTCLEKYGVSNVMQYTPIKEQSVSKSIFHNKHFQHEMTHMRSNRSDEEKQRIQQKIRYTTQSNHGVHNISLKHIHLENLNKQYIEDTFIQDNVFDRLAFQEYFGLHSTTCHKILKRLQVKYDTSKSSGELTLKQILRKNNINYISNDRSLGIELDITIPGHNIAIEYNGTYWHSYGLNNVNDKQGDLKYNKYRHYNKTQICEQNNIRLFHVNEYELFDPIKREIWKSVLLNALNKTPNKIYARKCIIKELPTREAREFIDNNHLQGYVQSSYKFGLYYNNKLVQVATFSKSRFNSYDYELIRLCGLINYNIVGGASKLIKYFKMHHKGSLVSYANRRWSQGKVYSQFKLINVSQPSPHYIKQDKILNRLSFQKHKLPTTLEHYNPELNSTQNIINNGYRILYDCGNLTYLC